MGNRQSTENFSDESKYSYQAPGSTDGRAPCPVLNSLANHGYLPRDGQNITPAMLQLVLQEKMGMSWVAAKALVYQAYKTTGKNGLLALADLNRHSADSMEHDASLSRMDAALSNNPDGKLDQERFNKFLSFSKDGHFLTTEDVAAARVYFTADSIANNPEVIWNASIERTAWAEAATLIHVLGKDGKISLDDARLFFEKQTFPPGWTKHPSFGVPQLLSTTKALQNAAHTYEEQQKLHSDADSRPN